MKMFHILIPIFLSVSLFSCSAKEDTSLSSDVDTKSAVSLSKSISSNANDCILDSVTSDCISNSTISTSSVPEDRLSSVESKNSVITKWAITPHKTFLSVDDYGYDLSIDCESDAYVGLLYVSSNGCELQPNDPAAYVIENALYSQSSSIILTPTGDYYVPILMILPALSDISNYEVHVQNTSSSIVGTINCAKPSEIISSSDQSFTLQNSGSEYSCYLFAPNYTESTTAYQKKYDVGIEYHFFYVLNKKDADIKTLNNLISCNNADVYSTSVTGQPFDSGVIQFLYSSLNSFKSNSVVKIGGTDIDIGQLYK